MNARRQRIEELFCAASELPAAERGAYLDASCGDDAELRTEVQALLDAAVGATDRLRGVIGHAAAATAVGQVGLRVGAYRLVEELGQGGMGAVYRAVRDDDEYRSEVAVKLLHSGLVTEAATARFRDERQILAGLEHPGIVRLVDGGTAEEGRPYLVMERVDGVVITRWVEERKLSVRARVELFREVCAAVAYAHQKLVVHRDLKPANILVTPDGKPKLLDFGIAKLLGSEGQREAHTGTGAQLLTPAYASPEQVRGAEVSTATDIYSLGAVLYELLAGVRAVPTDASRVGVMRAIVEVDPPRPSTIAPPARRTSLAGDLDNIVLKALHKEPEQRYASVEQLAADLGRYLDGLPVLARAGTWRYHAGKFVRRNRVAVAAAATVLVTLSAATAVSLVQARRADRQARRADAEAQRARRSFDEVRGLANSLLFEVDEKIRDLEGSTGARELIVSRALEYLDRLAREPGQDAALARELATAYMKIGDIQGSVLGPNLGRPHDGIASYRKAEQVLDRLAAGGAADDATRFARLRLEQGLGALQRAAGDEAAGRKSLGQAIAIAATIPHGPGFDYKPVVQSYVALVDLEYNTGETSAALLHARADMALAAEWVRKQRSPEARYFVACAHEQLGFTQLLAADPAAAAEEHRAALRELEALVAEHPENAAYRREVSNTLLGLASSLAGSGDTAIWFPELGDRAAGERALRRALALAEAETAKDPNDLRRQFDVVMPLTTLGALVASHDRNAGIAMLERARAIYEILPLEMRQSDFSRQNEWFTHCALAEPLARAGRRADALVAARRGSAITEQLARGPDAPIAFHLWVAMCRYQVARAHGALGDHAAAADTLEQAIAVLTRLISTHPMLIQVYVGLAESLELLAELQPEQRCKHLGRAVTAWRGWPGTSTAYIQRRRAELEHAVVSCAPHP